MERSKSAKTNMAAKPRSWTARPILGAEFTEAVPLQDAYVGVLKRRRDTSAAIRSISVALPAFAHLKRCSNGKLLLAPLRGEDRRDSTVPSLGEDQLKDQLRAAGFDVGLLEDSFLVTRVPARAPRTKRQAAEASKAWPVNFHPDPALERLVDGSVFDEARLLAIERIMSLVVDAARLQAVGDSRCTGAAAVVDPEDGRILALSAARMDQHPMWHAAMLAVDLVAELHGGGAWRLNGEARTLDVSEGDEGATDARGRLGRIKRRYADETPRCYPKSLASLGLPAQTPLTEQQEHVARNRPLVSASPMDESGPYLCTGYWVFLLMEPCPLCAMALLHSRVARILYGTSNGTMGVLGSRAALHTVPGLNHRYRVWSGILEQECRRALREISARGSIVEDNNVALSGRADDNRPPWSSPTVDDANAKLDKGEDEAGARRISTVEY